MAVMFVVLIKVLWERVCGLGKMNEEERNLAFFFFMCAWLRSWLRWRLPWIVITIILSLYI